MKKFNLASIFMMVALFLLLSACQPAAAPTNIPAASEIGKVVKVGNGSYKNISVTELVSLMNNKDFSLVNVHIPFEGNLPKTDLSLPYDTIGQNTAKLPGDKASKIVLYCRSGRMSAIAAEELVKLGYSNIWNLDGGMAAWEQAGQSIQK
jgi:rhodanese-related sulfurtransferase